LDIAYGVNMSMGQMLRVCTQTFFKVFWTPMFFYNGPLLNGFLLCMMKY
jgi:hypothetical protein